MTIIHELIRLSDEELFKRVEDLTKEYNQLLIDQTNTLGDIIVGITILANRAIRVLEEEKNATTNN